MRERLSLFIVGLIIGAFLGAAPSWYFSLRKLALLEEQQQLIAIMWQQIAELELELKRAREANQPESNDVRSLNLNEKDHCAALSVCTPVRVFFGTNRKRHDSGDRIDFGADRDIRLQLGNAIVTVPRATARKKGEIPRPNSLDRLFSLVPPEGDPAKHFTIPASGIKIYENEVDFIEEVRAHNTLSGGDFNDHAFIFVHGYNSTFDSALYRTAQIAYDIGGDGHPFGTSYLFSWPSGGALRDYKFDFDSARLAVEPLVSFLQLVIEKTGAKHVHLIAHSMGNWTLLSALKQMKTLTSIARINQVILAAPDVDSAEFEKFAESIAGSVGGITLYASSNDFAMRASREIHRGLPRAGDVPFGGPVVVWGVDTIDVTAISTETLSVGHNEYAARRELLNDIAIVLRRGERPPHIRMPILEKIASRDKMYWRYPR